MVNTLASTKSYYACEYPAITLRKTTKPTTTATKARTNPATTTKSITTTKISTKNKFYFLHGYFCCLTLVVVL